MSDLSSVMISEDYVTKVLPPKIENSIVEVNKRLSSHALYDPIKYIMEIPGKRMRPAVLVAMCEGYGGKYSDAISTALGIELFHNFTLMHDDIMDNAPLRRGVKTVHEHWDNNTAILSGDAMIVWSYKIMNDLKPELLHRVLEKFNDCALRVCEGQQMDMDFEKRENVSADEYLQMIRFKTAELLASSMELGALLGGASESELEKIYTLGIDIGIAFQLQDDYLDTFGSTAKVGKRIGGDVLEDKNTYLRIKALEKSTEEDLRFIRFGHNFKSDESKIETITEIFKKHSLDAEIGQLRDEYKQKAEEALLELEMDSEMKNAIQKVFNLVVARDK